MAISEIPPRLNELSHEVIGSAMAVHRALGAGLRERLYEVAIVQEMRSRGLRVDQQVPFVAMYRGVELPSQVIDLIIEDQIILELKSVREVVDEHFAQLLGYLRFTGMPLGLILNFAKPLLRDGIHRKINYPASPTPGVQVVRSGLRSVSSVTPL